MKLAVLTNTELIDLCQTLEHMGTWLLKLKALGVAQEFDLEDLLDVACNECFQRVRDDSEYIPEDRHE